MNKYLIPSVTACVGIAVALYKMYAEGSNGVWIFLLVLSVLNMLPGLMYLLDNTKSKPKVRRKTGRKGLQPWGMVADERR